MKWVEALARRNEARALLATASSLVQNARDREGLRPALDMLYQVVRLDPGFNEPLWHLAELYDHLGDLPQAREYYLSTLRLDPMMQNDEAASARVYGNLGRLYEFAAHPQDAVRFYNRYLCYFPLSPQASAMGARLGMLAECGGDWFHHFQDACREQLDGQHEAALANFDEALRLYPKSACIYFLRGMCLRSSGRHDDSISDMEKASDLDMNARTFVEMGTTYSMLGNLFVEEGFYERALQANPQDPMALYLLGTAAYERKDRGQALERLQKAVELSPDAPWAAKASSFVDDLQRDGETGFPACLQDPIEWSHWRHEMEGVEIPYPSKAHLIAHLETGQMVAFVDNPEKRVFSFRVRRANLPDRFDHKAFLRLQEKGLRQKTDTKVETVEYKKFNDLPALVIELREVKTDFVILQVWIIRGNDIFEFWCRSPWTVYQHAGDKFKHMIASARILPMAELFRHRKQVYEECVARQPTDIEALAGLGAALIGLGELEAAGGIYQRILARDAENARALGDLGLCYWEQDKLDLAIHSLTKATAKDPQGRLMRVLGMAYMRNGQADKAVKVYQRALEARPDKDIMMLLGVAYESLRKFDLAEREYKKVLLMEPSEFRVRMLLGALYHRLRRGAEAMAAYKEAVDMDPQSVEAHIELGICCKESLYWDAAEKHLGEALRIDFGNVAAKLALEELAAARRKARRPT